MSNCRWIQNNSGEITGALTQSGLRSKLFDDLQKQFSKEEAVAMYAVSQSDDFQEISSQEPTVENLLRYVTSQNRTTEKLTKEQLVDLQDFSNFDRERLINTFYDKNGLFLVDETKLVKSGLYSAYEAGMIANDAELQDTIKDALERLKNTSDEELQIVERSEVMQLNEFNSFGKLATIDAVSDLVLFGKNRLEALKKEIEANYSKSSLDIFNGQSDDIRMKAFNYDHPIAQKTLNGVDLRIAEGLIRDKKKTYLLYMNGEIVGEFPSVQTIKDIIKDIESRLIPNVIENQKQAEVFVQVGDEIRPKKNTETELILPITAKQTENSKVSDLSNLSLEILKDNEELTRQVLDEIENELIKDSIDVIGLSEKAIDENLKDFLAVLDKFIKDPTKENTKDFADKVDEYFQRDLSPKKENIDGENTKEYVKLETTLSEEEVYNQQGLIKLDDNTYIKTAKEDLTTLYENVRTYTEKYPKDKTLEEHVQEQLKDYTYTNAETLEAIILYKMYFSSPLEEVTLPSLTPSNVESYNGMFSKKTTGLPYYDDILNADKEDVGYHYFYKSMKGRVEMMSPSEYLKRVREGFNGYKDENITKEKVDAIENAVEKGSKIDMVYLSYVDGKFAQEGRNRAKTAQILEEKNIPVLIVESVTFEDKINKAQEYIDYALSKGAVGQENIIEMLKEDLNIHRDFVNFIRNNFEDFSLKSSQEITPTKQVSNFTGDYNYLTEEFPSDFYSKFLAEKKLNSKLFRNFYFNFEINEKGINLINKSETALRNIKIYADENLKQYSLISKQMPDLIDQTDNISNPRVEAINNPQKIKENKENLYKLNDQEIIIKNQTEDFVRIGNDIYESVAKQGNLNHLVKLETPTSDYYAVEVKAPQTNLNLSDYNYLNETPENFKSVKDFLKGENPEELSC